MATPFPTAEMPSMMYGTAWKEERTADLVYEAIKAGFRGIDTAAMKKHYNEAGVGEGIRRAIREGICSRKDLFIQTKFSPMDNTSDYSPTDPLPTQIHASITSSLTNLSTPDHSLPYLDALVLHSPFPTIPETLDAWAVLQSYLPSSSSSSPNANKILRLGISNTTLPVLQALSTPTHPVSGVPLTPPAIVQNRLRAAERAWDVDVRTWVAEQNDSTKTPPTGRKNKTHYQAFWTLTGNPSLWHPQTAPPFIRSVAQGAGVSLAGAWYALLIIEGGVTVLNGTTSIGERGHMTEDLEVVGKVERWRGTVEGGGVWGEGGRGFWGVLGGQSVTGG
ncbi:NADP-dependent oxidoreductase domain-containing protein [Chaetomium sp. MPI-SDFR-AT-0129]|nr:NADP-dependent oxidoreductase domain-containing protein [Chaetomium sp. MPI-SDFR-AT-0129]